jgi:hypothetical protein
MWVRLSLSPHRNQKRAKLLQFFSERGLSVGLFGRLGRTMAGDPPSSEELWQRPRFCGQVCPQSMGQIRSNPMFLWGDYHPFPSLIFTDVILRGLPSIGAILCYFMMFTNGVLTHHHMMLFFIPKASKTQQSNLQWSALPRKVQQALQQEGHFEVRLKALVGFGCIVNLACSFGTFGRSERAF